MVISIVCANNSLFLHHALFLCPYISPLEFNYKAIPGNSAKTGYPVLSVCLSAMSSHWNPIRVKAAEWSTEYLKYILPSLYWNMSYLLVLEAMVIKHGLYNLNWQVHFCSREFEFLLKPVSFLYIQLNSITYITVSVWTIFSLHFYEWRIEIAERIFLRLGITYG